MTGRKIKSLLKQKGIKMVFVANKIGVAAPDLTTALNGKRKGPRVQEILLLAAKFLKNK